MTWPLGFFVLVGVLGGLAVAMTIRVGQVVRDKARVLAPGSLGEVARLRRDLAGSRQSVRSSLAVARTAHAPLGDVPALLRRIEVAAVDVEAELRMVQAMRDPGTRTEAMAGPRARALALIAAADDLAAALVSAAAARADDLSTLRAECALEAEALRADR